MTAKLIEAMASAAAGGQTPRPPGHVQVGNPAKCGLSLPRVQSLSAEITFRCC